MSLTHGEPRQVPCGAGMGAEGREAPVLHCWADRRDCCAWGSEEWVQTFVLGNATCLLADGHDGPHSWTPDEEIEVEFPAEEVARG